MRSSETCTGLKHWSRRQSKSVSRLEGQHIIRTVKINWDLHLAKDKTPIINLKASILKVNKNWENNTVPWCSQVFMVLTSRNRPNGSTKCLVSKVLEIPGWGLCHIEKLREARERRANRTQMQQNIALRFVKVTMWAAQNLIETFHTCTVVALLINKWLMVTAALNERFNEKKDESHFGGSELMHDSW